MNVLFALLLLLLSVYSNAQARINTVDSNLFSKERMYDQIKLGKFGIGVVDTIIYDSKYSYKTNNYDGPRPYFIKIWHPINLNQSEKYLAIKDLFTINTPLNGIEDSLAAIYRKIFIQDYLSENLIDGEELNFGKYSKQEVFDYIGMLKTHGVYEKIKNNSNFPVIIYYNGSNGHPIENFLLAEYFASRGYLFIAVSFELQFEGMPFGMLPYERYHSGEYENNLILIKQFAKSISNAANIYFIGHSMGAQMGLRTFSNEKDIKGMVSLETSIEFKTELEQIKDLWPEVYTKIMLEKVTYPFPILFCAATGKAQAFNFLLNTNAESKYYLSTSLEFEHNAYLSIFYLRKFLGDSFIQIDKNVIESRFGIYLKHLDFIYDFIDGIENNKKNSVLSPSFIAD